MTSLDLNQQPLCIKYPNLDVDFKLKSGLIHLLPTFRGVAGEDPHKYLKKFHVVCFGIKPPGVTEEQVKLRAFPFSLGEKVKDWLYSLPSRSIVSWNELKKQFLEHYFPASRTITIRKEISGIRQFFGESFYEYWERFNHLVESCPHYQISDHLLIQYFYEGLTEANRSLVDAASGGALYDKTPTETRKLIKTMAFNTQQFGSINDNPPRKVNEVSASINERLDELTSIVKKFIVGGPQQVKACGICTSLAHFTDACPTLQEEPTMHANAIGGFSGPLQRGHDPFSNTFNTGWRDYPNLRYGNASQIFQKPPPPPQSNPNLEICQGQKEGRGDESLETLRKVEGDNFPNSTSILLGRSFLKTSKTKIDVDAGILSMEFDNEVVSFYIDGVTQNSNDMHSVFLIDFIDPLVQGNSMFDGGGAFKMTINKNLTSSPRTYKNKVFHEKISSRKKSSMDRQDLLNPHHHRVHFIEEVDLEHPTHLS
ncbi:UNVERIFIED_CONTAM: hypothetical protein Slati_3820700 [Sesamum latifolium]|uniref:Retrotransposon gag domain-containing protein n=1 Tax=Sesamum latifolium TaxID=2727402 RepID=A0AAW2U5W6_9LAMI